MINVVHWGLLGLGAQATRLFPPLHNAYDNPYRPRMRHVLAPKAACSGTWKPVAVSLYQVAGPGHQTCAGSCRRAHLAGTMCMPASDRPAGRQRTTCCLRRAGTKGHHSLACRLRVEGQQTAAQKGGYGGAKGGGRAACKAGAGTGLAGKRCPRPTKQTSNATRL